MKLDNLTPDNAVLNELGARLRRVRKQQRFSQDELAKMAGIGVATLRRIEDGSDSQLGSWVKILKALNMSASIEQLLPESFNSPMNEALSKKRRTPNKKAGFVWGDETQ